MSTRAELHMREALRGYPSPDMKRRIEKLLKAIEDRRHTSAEHRELRAVQALQWMDIDAARALSRRIRRWSRTFRCYDPGRLRLAERFARLCRLPGKLIQIQARLGPMDRPEQWMERFGSGIGPLRFCAPHQRRKLVS